MKEINQWRNFLMESDIGSVAKLVGFCMAQYYIPNKPTYPSLTTLTIDTQYCKNTVKSGIRDLEKAGFIRIEEKRMGNNSFKSHCYLFIGSTGDTINDTVNAPVIDIANDIANDIAPADPEVLEVFKGVKKEKDTIVSKKKAYSESFETFWKAYCRPKDKGSKPDAFKEWQKLTESEQQKAIDSIIPYKNSQSSPEYMKHAERYLKTKAWEGITIQEETQEELEFVEAQ